MKEQILTGTAKYCRLGSKGNRYKIIIDDVELSPYMKDQLDKNREDHKVKSSIPLLSIQDYIRKQKIEVRLL